jgi:hypothetical protein
MQRASTSSLVGVARDQAALHLCLAGPLLDRKVAALRAMSSQTSDLIAVLGLETYADFVAEECFVDVDLVRGLP